jgi:hypothetical protein
MSYFNHAFKKVFIGNATGFTGLAGGMLGTPGNIPASGQYCFVDAKSWVVQPKTGTSNKCCPLVLAGGSIYQNDKIGPFHGGYKETNKSKEINPKYVNRFYFSEACAPQNNIIHVGITPYTDDASNTNPAITNAGGALLNGTYTDVPLVVNTSTGTPYGIEATIVVAANIVSSITITEAGTGLPTTGTSTFNAGFTGFTATTVVGSNIIDITAITAGTIMPQVGQQIYGMTGVPAGSIIEAINAVGSTGLGTYTISNNATGAGSVTGSAYIIGYAGTGAFVNPLFTFTNNANGGLGCSETFLCGETYNLRLDVKGSPALRFLNHNAYLTVSAYTGCCAAGAIAPTPVDPGIVMIEWAKQINNSPLISPFILPVVTTIRGSLKQLWYPEGATVSASGFSLGGTLEQFAALPYVAGYTAGITLTGAYVDTKFGDCTFQTSDFYEVEPVRLYASEVDLNGDPCTFSSICVVTECQGRQGSGYGETYLRDLVLSEAYRQNFLSSDFRIREITQGTDIIAAVPRGTSATPNRYNAFYLQHNVPRFNNPSSTFDNDQYLLEIVVPTTVNPNDGLNGEDFANFVNNWLDACGNNCSEIETFECVTACTPLITASR